MKIIEMTEEHAKKIIGWIYEKPYDIYNMTEAYDDLMAGYLAVVDEELIGFYCYGAEGQVPPGDYGEIALDIGVGMDPNLCGHGKGKEFVELCMTYGKATYHLPLRLTVATFNKRAIKLYENLGFVKKSEFKRGDRSFQIMML